MLPLMIQSRITADSLRINHLEKSKSMEVLRTRRSHEISSPAPSSSNYRGRRRRRRRRRRAEK